MGKATTPRSRSKIPMPQPPRPGKNLAESPISWLHARGYLTRRQFDAGETLRDDWERAQFDGIATMRWSPLVDSRRRRGPPEQLEPGERAIAARRRFEEAMQAVGRDMNDLCWRVICACESIPTVEKDLGWPTRSGKLVLRMALDRIADYYRIAEG
ncbi:MAG: DUF6456 domain-containing protein [Pseudomonadota bacterium]